MGGGAIDRYVSERVGLGEWAPNTARNARTVLSALCDSVHDIRDVGPGEIADLLAHCHAPATRRRWFAVLRGFFAWATARGLLERDPTVAMKGPRVGRAQPRGLDDLAMRRIWNACRDDRDRLIISLARYEGLRRAEIAGISADDLTSDFVYVTGKGGKTRFVPLSPATVEAIRRYTREHPLEPGRPLLRDERHPEKGVQPPAIGRAATRIMRAAGVADVERPRSGASLHALRHTAAHELLALPDADPRDVADWLGHAHVATTLDIYGRRQIAVTRLQRLAAARG